MLKIYNFYLKLIARIPETILLCNKSLEVGLKNFNNYFKISYCIGNRESSCKYCGSCKI